MKHLIQKILIVGVLVSVCVLSGRAAESISLAGQWRFKLDEQDQGIKESWPQQVGNLPDKIKLPGTTDEAGYGLKMTNAETGVLTRRFNYYGPAWYQREITVPESWKDKDTELFLERVIWQSRVWVDGKESDEQDSLNTPHVHQLGRLSPGKHVLLVRIDNRPQYPIGVLGHSYTEQTQTIWNGAVGRIELRARNPLHITRARVFPDAPARKVTAEISLQNDNPSARTATVILQLRKHDSHKIVAQSETNCEVAPGGQIFKAAVQLEQTPDLWDEFAPNLYTLDVTVKADGLADSNRETFGFRSVSRVDNHVAINNRPIFVRGNLDCVHFPLTGYPAMDVDGWKRIFKIYQSYGLNEVHFHSWTPPDAAFTAADELGIYIQSEVLWTQRPLGKDQPGRRLEDMGKFAGSFPESLMLPPGTIDPYIHAEIRRGMNAYGNHPSFTFFTIGNEMGGIDPEICGGWIQEIKTYDPRRFYSATTARRILPQDDYSVTHAIPDVGWIRDAVNPFNDWDYEKLCAQAPVPIIAHEVGQWTTHPLWAEIAKYTGVLRAWNFEHFHALAVSNGVAGLDREFCHASGMWSQRLYKDEIESHLRTADCAGFDLLSLQDFSGQGEALVGWLDSFYDSKGFVTPARFSRWCQATVPLARLPKYVYETGETLTGRVDVAHYGPVALTAKASWSLRDESGKILEQGTFAPTNLPVSSVSTRGSLSVKLDRCVAPCRARLEVHLDGTHFANDWDIWVFPPPAKLADETGPVEMCTSLETALEKLHAGKKVLLDAHELGNKQNAGFGRFFPGYWSAAMFPGQFTMGAFIRDEHPALKQFPTENHYDWQWNDICQNARGFLLDGLPLDYQPIVQPICDFHFNWKLGSIFELGVGKGKLLVCGYDLSNRLDKRPATRQLRASLLAYMNSSAFKPHTQADEAQLAKMFPIVRTAPIAMPTGFENAAIYVKAGAKDTANGNTAWQPALDDAKIAEAGFGYNVQCDNVWKDSVATAWWSDSNLRIEVSIPTPKIYDFYVHFQDWNNYGREGKIKFQGREYELGPHTGDGKWVKLEVLREDYLAGKITLEAIPTAGGNLLVTAIALVPRQ